MPSDAYIKDTVIEYINSSEHPDLQVYRRDFGEKFGVDLWLWRMKHLVELGHFKDQRVLEVGCGFGWDAVGLALAGGNRIVASDILPSMVEGMRECLEGMKRKGKPLPIEPMQGDICNLDLDDGSVDGIISLEAIEHVHDLDAMFQRCFQLLRAGGRMILVNDSNRYNEEARRHAMDGWRDRDESWEFVNGLRDVRPVEHGDAKPYAVVREDFIRAEFPDLGADDMAKLVRATAGMIKPEILDATRRYLSDGSLPTPPEFSWCRNPETGEYAERVLDPFVLKAMLAKHGFKVQLRHLFRKFPYRLLNGVDLRLINQPVFGVRAVFALVARKPN